MGKTIKTSEPAVFPTFYVSMMAFLVYTSLWNPLPLNIHPNMYFKQVGNILLRRPQRHGCLNRLRNSPTAGPPCCHMKITGSRGALQHTACSFCQLLEVQMQSGC